MLDPFGYCRGEAVQPFLKGMNLLDLVKVSDDLHMLADGIVKRTPGESQPHWNDSATEVIAGLLAYILEAPTLPATDRHIGALRAVLSLVQAEEKISTPILSEMAACTGFARLASQTARRLAKGDNETANIISTVQTQTRWLTFERMANWLTLPSGFDLHDLKRSRLTVFLVIPPDMLKAQGQFLRLFVRAAIGVMQTRADDGAYKGTPCLMILDEFYSLGRMSEMQEAAAQMRKFALHLWPFLQDWGQLVELYGEHGAQGFLTNSDATSVFGIADPATLREISRWFDNVTPDEIEPMALQLADQIEGSEGWRKHGFFSKDGDFIRNQRLAVRMALLQSKIGKPRRSPSEIQYAIGKRFEDRLARKMYVFLRDGQVSELDLTST